MPSVRYYNESAPFWDWIASMESNNNGQHPWFAQNPWFNARASQARQTEEPSTEKTPPPDYKADETQDGPGPSQQPQHDQSSDNNARQEGHHPCGPPPHHHEGPPGCHRGPRRQCGGRRGGFGRHGRGGFPFGGFSAGAWSGFGNREDGAPFDLNNLAEAFAQQFGFVPDTKEKAAKENSDKDFTPPVDVFDTTDAYVIHISLPGAKKEDVGVNWDADKSEVSVAGVVYRIGDEEMLKTLAMDERDVGLFERKIRLGSRANPANVDADNITAKMEDGVLVVKVPKNEEFVEVMKVDVE